MIFRRKRNASHQRAGDLAMAQRRWAEAAHSYALVLANRPDHTAIWVQYGHALKESGDLDGAIKAYTAAIASNETETDARLHLAWLLHREGRLADAIDVFAAILAIDPLHIEAQTALIGSGARNRLPANTQRAAFADVSHIQEKIDALTKRMNHWIDVSTYPLNNYNGFRQDCVIQPPPPADGPLPSIAVHIDARGTIPYFLRATLLSLIDQEDTAWTATIAGDASTRDHPVGSLAAIDPRIAFADATKRIIAADYILHISAGTVLDRQAIAWFRYAAQRSAAPALWCDFDHGVEPWRGLRRYEHPILWGVFDIDLMAQTNTPPIAVMTAAGSHNITGVSPAAEQRRALLLNAGSNGPVAHIPRILATVLRAPEQAEHTPEAEALLGPASYAPPATGPVAGTSLMLMPRANAPSVSIGASASDDPIHIIIPTRDGADILVSAVTSLMTRADDQARITITIIDNRSRETETALALERLKHDFGVEVMPLDEPFNWSRANNLALQKHDDGIALFANNDIEMLTQGWDRLLRGYLSQSDVGAVGCRLLYPDHSIQHAGILFGLGDGPPIHDGAGVEYGDHGPQDRYRLTHAAAAVTGAFLSAHRSLIDKIGGFDELSMAVAFNDVDFCMKVRTEGLKILYAPAIEALHYESRTRGVANNAVRIAWDQGELRALHQRWGDAMLIDPGYNPHWTTSRAYDGFRNPAMRQILEHLDLSARAEPWGLRPEDRG